MHIYLKEDAYGGDFNNIEVINFSNKDLFCYAVKRYRNPFVPVRFFTTIF